MRYVSWIITVPLTVIIIVFAVSNRHAMSIELWPLPIDSVVLPTYLVLLVALLLGIILGGIISWLAAGKTRSKARQARYRAEYAEREVNRLTLAKEKDAERSAAQAVPKNSETKSLTASAGQA